MINSIREAVSSAAVAAEVADLRLKFPGERDFVFKDVSFTVRRGEKVLLLGPSGSGKSTLLQVLSGIIPDVVEVPMRCSAKRLPSSWGLLFQDPDTQFCMPYADEELAFVMENLGVPRAEMPGRMDEVLAKVGLRLGEVHVTIDSLSQGMKQRLALASVLLGEPEVLFLDEPSALLDPEGRRQIWHAVRQIAKDRTLIIVEHRLEELLSLGLVDSVVLFGPGGRLLGQGPPQEIFARFQNELKEYGIWYPGVWEDFFGSPDGGELKTPVAGPLPSVAGSPASVIELADFRGMRNGHPVIEVEEAVVKPGDFIAVTGPNGAGKSSLLLSLMGLLPTQGNYALKGMQMKEGKVRRGNIELAAREIGFVFQNPEFQFVADRVAAEIAFSLREDGFSIEEVTRRVAITMETYGLSGFGERHPYQLSLGQKRRLSVAGAAVRERPLLLLDEPTFGQDAVNTFAILRQCEELRRRGTAIIMVTHEEMIADEVATQRWEVQDGRLVSRELNGRGMKPTVFMPVAAKGGGLR